MSWLKAEFEFRRILFKWLRYEYVFKLRKGCKIGGERLKIQEVG